MKQLFYIFIIFLSNNLFAQDSLWTLQRCIDYAIENNLSIQQNELDNRLSEINLNSAKMNHYPTLNLSSNYGGNFGRSINPTTNQFENTQYSYTGLSASSNVLVFGWFQKRYNAQKSDLEVQQSKENYEQLKDDIALNISTAYLRALLANEQINNVLYQIDLSQINKNRIEKLLENGRSNVLELSQSKTQLATDSSLYLQAVLNYEQAIIELKTLLNFEYSQNLIIDTNKTEAIYFLEKQNPETIYNIATNDFHSVKASEYSIKIAEKDVQIAKANSLPQLNLFYSAGTNYSSSFYEYLPSGERQLMNFGKQLNSNLSHSIGLGISIPVFNNFSFKNSIKSAEINLQKSQITNLETRQKLKQDIYTACTDYELTLQKYQNAQNILSHSKTSYEASQVRYENGLITYFEYSTEKTNYLKSQNEASALKYDLWFKKMLVERFKNGGLINKY